MQLRVTAKHCYWSRREGNSVVTVRRKKTEFGHVDRSSVRVLWFKVKQSWFIWNVLQLCKCLLLNIIPQAFSSQTCSLKGFFLGEMGTLWEQPPSDADLYSWKPHKPLLKRCSDLCSEVDPEISHIASMKKKQFFSVKSG